MTKILNVYLLQSKTQNSNMKVNTQTELIGHLVAEIVENGEEK